MWSILPRLCGRLYFSVSPTLHGYCVNIWSEKVEEECSAGVVSRRRPLPREKGSGDISIANLFCWNADMSLRAQKLRSSQGNCNDVWSIYSTLAQCSAVFFLLLQFCALLVGLIPAQNPELILVLVKKSIIIRLTIVFCRMMQNVRLRANNNNIGSCHSQLAARKHIPLSCNPLDDFQLQMFESSIAKLFCCSRSCRLHAHI